MYEIFVKLLQENGLTPYKFSKLTGIAQSTLSDWKTGKSRPKPDKMIIIADYFGVSVHYLEGEQENKNDDFIENVADELFKKRKLLFDKTAKATEEDMDKILKIVSTLMGDDNE